MSGLEGAALGIREQAIEKYLALVKDKRDLQRKNQKVPQNSSRLKGSFQKYVGLAFLKSPVEPDLQQMHSHSLRLARKKGFIFHLSSHLLHRLIYTVDHNYFILQVQTRIAQHLRKHKIELSASTPGKS